MPKEITTEIVINATPGRVWAILTDFEKYPEWNPFIRSIKGEAKVGSKITARLEPPNAKGMTFKPKVLVVETNKEFRWLGHLLFPGLFDGEHSFILTDNGNGTTTFRQNETFKGILTGLMNFDNVKKGFQAMNEKLKELAERS